MIYLLLVLAAIVIFAFSRAGKHTAQYESRTRTDVRTIQEDLTLLDTIALSVTEQLGVGQLDHTDASIDVVERMLLQHRTNVPSDSTSSRVVIAFGSYMGTLLVRNHHGAWQSDVAQHPLPFIELPSGVRASPFDLISVAQSDPSRPLKELYASLVSHAQPNEAPRSASGTALPEHPALPEA